LLDAVLGIGMVVIPPGHCYGKVFGGSILQLQSRKGEGVIENENNKHNTITIMCIYIYINTMHGNIYIYIYTYGATPNQPQELAAGTIG
jgi:hypothetical protein